MTTATATPNRAGSRRRLPEHWPYQWAVLPLSGLFVDMEYQRPLNEAFLRKMDKEYNPALIGALTVSDRGDGQYAVFDGQHRLVTMRKKDEAVAPCLVYTGLTVAEEAALFSALQTERRRPKSLYRFRSDVTAGKERAVAIDRIAERLGFTIAEGKGGLKAVVALETTYDIGGDGLVAVTLATISSAWPDWVPSGEMIRGLGRFLRTYEGEADLGELLRRLTNTPHTRIAQMSSALREGSGHGGGSDVYTARAILNVYNNRRREKLPDRF